MAGKVITEATLHVTVPRVRMGDGESTTALSGSARSEKLTADAGDAAVTVAQADDPAHFACVGEASTIRNVEFGVLEH